MKYCEVCRGRMTMHCFRPKGKRGEKAVYGHCKNPDCERRKKEVCYLGDLDKVIKQTKPSYLQKRAIEKDYMNVARTRVSVREERV